MNTSHSAHESLWQRLRRHLTWLFTPPHATNWQPSKALGIQPVAMPEKPGLPPWAGRPLFEITPVSMPAVHPPLPLQEIARDKFEECGTNPKPGTFARLVDQAIRARTGEVPKLAQKPLPECETLPLADDPALQTIQDERPDVPLKPNPMALTGFAANLMAPSSNSDWLNSPLPRPDIWGEVEELAQKSGILPAIEPDTLEEANETEHSAAIRDIVKTRAATRAVRRRLNYMLPPLQPPHEREDK